MNAVSPEADLSVRQFRFAAHIRDPDSHPAPKDVSNARMALYRELFFNNIRGVIEDTFPAACERLGAAEWERLARHFFAEYLSPAPCLHQLPGEFVAWLSGRSAVPLAVRELAHYEWLELSLAVLPGEPPTGEIADLLGSTPRLSELAALAGYRNPVHRLRDGGETGPEPTHLLLWRDHADEVHTFCLDPAAARLMQLIGDGSDDTGARLLARVADELNHPEPQQVVEAGRMLLADLYRRGALDRGEE